jgi:hypothetical protein
MTGRAAARTAEMVAELLAQDAIGSFWGTVLHFAPAFAFVLAFSLLALFWCAICRHLCVDGRCSASSAAPDAGRALPATARRSTTQPSVRSALAASRRPSARPLCFMLVR